MLCQTSMSDDFKHASCLSLLPSGRHKLGTNRRFHLVILLMEEILHQLRLVVSPIIYSVFNIPGGAGFLNHATVCQVTSPHPKSGQRSYSCRGRNYGGTAKHTGCSCKGCKYRKRSPWKLSVQQSTGKKENTTKSEESKVDIDDRIDRII